MIYQFETRAGGRITYTDVVGAQLLHILGKQPGPRGVIVLDDIPAAIRALESAVERDRALSAQQQQDVEPHHAEDAEAEERERGPRVSLAQRAFPLLDLLQYALAQREDVTWGI